MRALRRARATIRTLPRWTPFTFLAPSRYVERGAFWRHFDLHQWSSAHYTWESDGWNGYRDLAQKPSETVERGVGDCEDYALVAASWALANDHTPAHLGFCWEARKPHPTHVVCYDSECVYSSGDIHRVSVEEYLSNSPYSRILGRLVT